MTRSLSLFSRRYLLPLAVSSHLPFWPFVLPFAPVSQHPWQPCAWHCSYRTWPASAPASSWRTAELRGCGFSLASLLRSSAASWAGAFSPARPACDHSMPRPRPLSWPGIRLLLGRTPSWNSKPADAHTNRFESNPPSQALSRWPWYTSCSACSTRRERRTYESR